MKVGTPAVAKVILLHVSVTALMSDSIPKVPPPHKQGYRSCQPSSLFFIIKSNHALLPCEVDATTAKFRDTHGLVISPQLLLADRPDDPTSDVFLFDHYDFMRAMKLS